MLIQIYKLERFAPNYNIILDRVADTNDIYNEYRIKIIDASSGVDTGEMPDAVNLEMPFGKFTTKYEIKDNKLGFTRSDDDRNDRAG